MVRIANHRPSIPFRFAHHVGFCQFLEDLLQHVVAEMQGSGQFRKGGQPSLLQIFGHDTQHMQRIQQLGGRRQVVRSGGAPMRQRRRDHRASQDDQPGKIYPHQEYRHAGERAIHQFIGGEMADVITECAVHGLKGDRCNERAGQRMGTRHMAIWHDPEQQGKRHRGKQDWQ